MEKITMWTGQHKRVLETLERDGVYYVKNEYMDQKYGETAWIFKEAYQWFVKKAITMIPKPDEAQSPVWIYKNRHWALVDDDTALLKLSVPRNELILFDTDIWNKVLNLSYIGEEEKFEKKFRQMGVKDSLEIFTKPYYPLLKREVMDSWNILFENNPIESEHLQGAVWNLKDSWIEEVIF